MSWKCVAFNHHLWASLYLYAHNWLDFSVFSVIWKMVGKTGEVGTLLLNGLRIYLKLCSLIVGWDDSIMFCFFLGKTIIMTALCSLMRCVTILHCKVHVRSGTVGVSLSIVTYLYMYPVVLWIVCYHLFDMISVFKLRIFGTFIIWILPGIQLWVFCILILAIGFQAFLVSISCNVSIRAGMGTWILPRSTGTCQIERVGYYSELQYLTTSKTILIDLKLVVIW